jgi:hypothetical protein
MDAAFMIYTYISCVDVEFYLTIFPGQNFYNVPDIGVDDVINIQLLVTSIAFQVQDVS